MIVETYEEREVDSAGEVETDDTAAIELIKTLELSGQLTRIAPKDDTKTNPYRAMTTREFVIFTILCPTKTEVGEYDAGPIPLRALQVIAHVRELGLYKRLEIWHDSRVKDPVLVGCVERWNGMPHILARWGAELENLEILAKRAAIIYRDKMKATLMQIKAEVALDEMLIASDGFLPTNIDRLDCRYVGLHP